MADYRVTEAEALQWTEDYPFPGNTIVIKPFPKPTDAPLPSSYLPTS